MWWLWSTPLGLTDQPKIGGTMAPPAQTPGSDNPETN